MLFLGARDMVGRSIFLHWKDDDNSMRSCGLMNGNSFKYVHLKLFLWFLYCQMQGYGTFI